MCALTAWITSLIAIQHSWSVALAEERRSRSAWNATLGCIWTVLQHITRSTHYHPWSRQTNAGLDDKNFAVVVNSNTYSCILNLKSCSMVAYRHLLLKIVLRVTDWCVVIAFDTLLMWIVPFSLLYNTCELACLQSHIWDRTLNILMKYMSTYYSTKTNTDIYSP